MKLRNKKTGGIIELDKINLVFDDGYAPFSSLRKLNEYWEDYKPAEPLIKDEKIRKAVRTWADANDYSKLWVYHDHTAISFYNKDDNVNQITFKTMEKFGLDHLGCYTITELCGEEEE